MGNEVSGIARTVLQSRAGVKPMIEEPQEDMTVNFMELMNQNMLYSNGNISADSREFDNTRETEKIAQNVYDAYSKSERRVSIKEKTTSEEIQAEASEPIETFEEDIRKILKEELNVTDEQISLAMENLGMSALDFRNLQNLAALIQTLTGEDIGTLFLSESFQTVMEQVSVLTDELCAELGVTKEELESLCQLWNSNGDKETIRETENMIEAQAPDESMEVTIDSDSEEIPVDTTEAKTNTLDAELPKEAAGLPVVQDEEAPIEDTPIEEKKEPIEQAEIIKETSADRGESTEEGFQNDSFKHSQNAKSDTNLNSSVHTVGQQNINHEEFIIPQEDILPHTNQVDTMELIQQIAKNVRVTISATTTSMEMQLNPENLGKIYLNVSERDGVVRAQIATQTEVVKEALESQLVELRQSLNQQGVKVDSIEVTVATHEFEQNLDGDAKQEEQMQKQREESQKQGRRSLSLEDLDTLSARMSEEEQLAAKIMRDNGNQVDYTA